MKKTSNILIIALIVLVIPAVAILSSVVTVLIINQNNKQIETPQNKDINNNQLEVNEEANISKIEPKQCDVINYTNSDYSDFKFSYDCNWKLIEESTKPDDFRDYTINLVNVDPTITGKATIKIDAPTFGATPICEKGSYVLLKNDFARIKADSKDLSAYHFSIELKGSAAFNERTQGIPGKPYPETDFCHIDSSSFGTRSNVISDGKIITKGNYFYASVLVTTDITNEVGLMQLDKIIEVIKFR